MPSKQIDEFNEKLVAIDTGKDFFIFEVKWVLESFYLNFTKYLFLLQIDCKKLGDGLIYEDVDGSNVFPHFYGPSRSFVPLTLDMVVKSEGLILSNGKFVCSMLN
ncbi:unnamed protein product [Lactuca virosa]|uniref:Uncharacterized protein n=1 Tax=Lactuca virosa TaxID=75947 RepID=A0AAU9LUW0_9ASTR|nr:unnamed protein product [Lactuca virosa]